MIVSTQISWPAVNFPAASGANNYLVYNASGGVVANATNANPSGQVATGTVSATVTYDDTQTGTIWTIRPVDSVTSPTIWGPAQSVVVGKLNCRGWFRAAIRKSMADRSDVVGISATLADDELNHFIENAIRDYSIKFPLDGDTTIQVNLGGPPGDRQYSLPSDCYRVTQVSYNRVNGHLVMYLEEMPWKGGETESTNWVGYAKFGIWQSPLGGRYYPGHYYVFEGNLWIDFDPGQPTDYMVVHYKKLYPLPSDDVTLLTIPEADLELILLYAEAQAWLLMESKDVRLSRWRTKDDGSRRDDMPTEKMSTRLFNAYNQKLIERRTLRVRNIRLVRRT